jgi:hypothetical protein
MPGEVHSGWMDKHPRDDGGVYPEADVVITGVIHEYWFYYGICGQKCDVRTCREIELAAGKLEVCRGQDDETSRDPRVLGASPYGEGDSVFRSR